MAPLFIRNASALGPLGAHLDDIWARVLAGERAGGTVSLPGERRFFTAETVAGSAGADLSAYAPLFQASIRALVAGLDITEPVDAVFLATAVGNFAEIEHRIYRQRDIPVETLDFAAAKRVFLDAGVIRPGARFICVPTGCCAGLQAIGLAKAVMPRLGLRTAVIMALDFGLTPVLFEAFAKIKALCENGPGRPFCAERDGFLFADGGGALLVTTEPDAPDQARISGYGCVSSAYHMTDIHTDGDSIRRCIELALADARLDASHIDHVDLHASGTLQNDAAEHNALAAVIGHDLPPITAFKGHHGHALAGANLIEVALSWKILKEHRVPPTPAHLPMDAYDDVPPRAASTSFNGRRLLKTASGFSGIHAALVLER